MAAASKKEEATQLKASAVMENSLPIKGSATLSAEPMKGVRNALRVTARRMGRLFLSVMKYRYRPRAKVFLCSAAKASLPQASVSVKGIIFFAFLSMSSVRFLISHCA